MTPLYTSDEEIQQVVRDFETCATRATDFHHREHLTVAVWYLQTLSPVEAVERMRSMLLRFLDHHGVDRQKYSEEITVFWIEMIADKLGEITADASLVEKCNQVLESFSSTTHTPIVQVEVEE
jgi:hypothetical protein